MVTPFNLFDLEAKMDKDNDIQGYTNRSNGASNVDSSITVEGLNIAVHQLNKAINKISMELDSLYQDQANLEEMAANLLQGYPIWHNLYEDEKDWLEWGYPWIKKHLDKKT